MKMHILLGLFIGTLFSTVVYAVYEPDSIDEKNKVIYVSGNDIKIRIDKMKGDVAKGRIMVMVDGKWYPFEKSQTLFIHQM